MKRILTISACLLVACSSNDGDDAKPDAGSADDMTSNTKNNAADLGPSPQGYATCPADTAVGGFAVTLQDSFSTVQGRISTGVDPNTVLDVEATSGPCALLRPPQLFCDPGCDAGTTCDVDGTCVALPENRSAGVVSLDGLSVQVSMEPREPVFFYNFTGDLPHPAFTEGAEVTLTAAGEDGDGFSITAVGTAALQTSLAEVPIDAGTGAAVSWTAGASGDDVKVELELNLANHGGTPGRIRCTVEDTGAFTIPAELVDTLLAGEASGFPSLRLTRQGAGAANTESGCVDLRLSSEILLPVEVPGLTSCSTDEDCDGQLCQADLTCG